MLRAVLALVPFLLPAAVAAQTIEWWQKDLDGALAAAKDKPAAMVLVYCWKDGHGICMDMFQGTLSDPKVGAALADFVCMGAKDDATGKPVLAKYGIEKVPTVLFVDPDGAVVDVTPGYVPVAEFVAEIARIRAGTDTIGGLKKQIAATPGDLALQMRLVRKLRTAGDKKGSLLTIEAIVQKDPKLASEPAAEAMLLKLCDEIFQPGIAPKDVELKPLREFLAKQRNKRIVFLGNDRIAGAEYRRGNLKAAAEAASRAWKSIPPDQVLEWGQLMAGRAYENWQALDKIDKDLLKLALEISKKALEEVEKRHKVSPDNPFLGSALYLHAAVQIVNNQRKEAFATMDRAISVDPANENLKKARERWLDGSK